MKKEIELFVHMNLGCTDWALDWNCNWQCEAANNAESRRMVIFSRSRRESKGEGVLGVSFSFVVVVPNGSSREGSASVWLALSFADCLVQRWRGNWKANCFERAHYFAPISTSLVSDAITTGCLLPLCTTAKIVQNCGHGRGLSFLSYIFYWSYH